jgi:hypothetical protein
MAMLPMDIPPDQTQDGRHAEITAVFFGGGHKIATRGSPTGALKEPARRSFGCPAGSSNVFCARRGTDPPPG